MVDWTRPRTQQEINVSEFGWTNPSIKQVDLLEQYVAQLLKLLDENKQQVESNIAIFEDYYQKTRKVYEDVQAVLATFNSNSDHIKQEIVNMQSQFGTITQRYDQVQQQITELENIKKDVDDLKIEIIDKINETMLELQMFSINLGIVLEDIKIYVANAESSKNFAAASALNAANSATSAADSSRSATSQQALATAAATKANTSAIAANDSAILAQKWAENPEDTAVTTGLFSAHHWATKAQKFATAIQQSVVFKGAFDASFGSLPIAPGATDPTPYYRISKAGTLNAVSYIEGDWIYWDPIGKYWYKISAALGSNVVSSVNGLHGDVVITPATINAVPTTRTINGISLNNNISLTASDVGAITLTDVNSAINTSLDAVNVKIGRDAGKTGQGEQAVAVGAVAGQSGQGRGSIAVGTNSGHQNQGQFAVAVGLTAGSVSQGEYAVALGYYAGQTNQPDHSIAIGYGATPASSGAIAIKTVSHSITVDSNGFKVDGNAVGGSKLIHPDALFTPALGWTVQDENLIIVEYDTHYHIQGLITAGSGHTNTILNFSRNVKITPSPATLNSGSGKQAAFTQGNGNTLTCLTANAANITSIIVNFIATKY